MLIFIVIKAVLNQFCSFKCVNIIDSFDIPYIWYIFLFSRG